MLNVTEAFLQIMACVPDTRTDVVDLQHASGRYLAEPVFADRDYPPINRATMDGIAISSASWSAGIRSWTIEQTLPAGLPSTELKDVLHGCAQIMTGAEMPDRADGIIPYEQLSISASVAGASSSAVFQTGHHVHAKGIDRKAGELLLSGGVRLDAPRIAIMASVGHARVKVARPPRVALLSTGNEIVPVNAGEPAPTQVRASNLLALQIGLQQVGITEISAVHVPDNLEKTTAEIQRLLASHDLLLLSGGVSMGKYDFVPEALRRCGVRQVFHKVAQKPGKPLWFGQAPNGFVFGLPGNPVSTLTVFRRYVVPFILASMGNPARHPALTRLAVTFPEHPSLTTFPPVSLIAQDHGIMQVEPVTYHGSGDFAALAESDGFVEIPSGPASLAAETIVPYFSWSEFRS